MKFSFLFFLLPLQIFAQDITGVWSGTLYNDTTRQFIKYEIAVSNYNGKLSGYSHIIYIIDSVENIGVKSIKIKKQGQEFLVEDDKLIYNNYTSPPAKGVKTYSELILSQNDTAIVLSGSWNTNQTKIYQKLTGNIFLQKKKEIEKTLIIPKLETLGLAKTLSFMTPTTRQKDLTVLNKSGFIPAKLKDQATVDSGNIVIDKKEKVNSQNDQLYTKKETSSQTNAKGWNTNDSETAKVIPKKNRAPVEKRSFPINETKKRPVDISNNIKAIPQAAAEIATRKIETVRSVEIKQDSLLLTLYDNGEIDGDTVSVLLNGNIIMAMQGLTGRGISKTIYITPQMGDSIVLIMYAENLGSIPPNTGLLVIHDGEDIFEIRFAGDLRKNSAIILKRKKKQ